MAAIGKAVELATADCIIAHIVSIARLSESEVAAVREGDDKRMLQVARFCLPFTGWSLRVYQVMRNIKSAYLQTNL